MVPTWFKNGFRNGSENGIGQGLPKTTPRTAPALGTWSHGFGAWDLEPGVWSLESRCARRKNNHFAFIVTIRSRIKMKPPRASPAALLPFLLAVPARLLTKVTMGRLRRLFFRRPLQLRNILPVVCQPLLSVVNPVSCLLVILRVLRARGIRRFQLRDAMLFAQVFRAWVGPLSHMSQIKHWTAWVLGV